MKLQTKTIPEAKWLSWKHYDAFQDSATLFVVGLYTRTNILLLLQWTAKNWDLQRQQERQMETIKDVMHYSKKYQKDWKILNDTSRQNRAQHKIKTGVLKGSQA